MHSSLQTAHFGTYSGDEALTGIKAFKECVLAMCGRVEKIHPEVQFLSVLLLLGTSVTPFHLFLLV